MLVYMYVFIHLLHHEQDITQDLFLSRVQLVWIQSFPSQLFALKRLKKPVWLRRLIDFNSMSTHLGLFYV